MQRAIEALLAAYLDERQKEARIMQELLTALSVGAAGRQKMFDSLNVIGSLPVAQASEVAVQAETASAAAGFAALSVIDDLTLSIGKLRKARDAALRH